jgi:hypothetical protein
LKTKRVAGCFDLGPEYFAFVGDLEKPESWKLPLFGGSHAVTKTLIRNALHRFASTKDIPATQREDVWKAIRFAAAAHGIKAGLQPVSAMPGSAHPETAQPSDAAEQELKQAHAVGELAAERFLRTIGY